MSITSRAAWGARPLDRRARVQTAPAPTLEIHHTVTGDAPFLQRMRDVERYHMDTRGWSGPAYNMAAGVRPGERAEFRGWAANSIANTRNVGKWSIVAVGNFDTQGAPDSLLGNIAQIAAEGIRRGHLARDFRIIGHRDEGDTACPGANLYPHLGRIRGRILELVGSAGLDASPEPTPPVRPGPDRLIPGQSLARGDRLTSRSGRYILVHQRDGNVVVYAPGNRPIWHTGTYGRSTHALVMQHDGNVVLYGPGMAALWSSGTGGRGTATLVMQDDGNLVAYQGTRAIWDSQGYTRQGGAAQPPIRHTVRPGESLSVIAQRYGTTVAAIQSANGIANPNVIRVGQVLSIPRRSS